MGQARNGSAILSASDKKELLKTAKTELKTIDSTLKANVKTRQALDKQDSKLAMDRIKAEAKVAALTPPKRTPAAQPEQQALAA